MGNEENKEPFDKNMYMRDYMREYRKKKKEAGKDTGNEINKEDVKESGKEPNKVIDNNIAKVPDNKDGTVSVNVESGNKKAEGKKGKKKNIKLPMTPESFADFSISLDELTVNLAHKDKLKDYEKTTIKSAAMEMAKVVEIPIFMVVVNYGFVMVLPHISRYVDKQNEKADWEIRKIQEELKAKGVNISAEELKYGNKEKIKERIDKEIELNEMKKRYQTGNVKQSINGDGEDVIL